MNTMKYKDMATPPSRTGCSSRPVAFMAWYMIDDQFSNEAICGQTNKQGITIQSRLQYHLGGNLVNPKP
jgi:hypothetical protein